MSILPVPQDARFVLHKGGIIHNSPYSGAIMASITFGERRIWQVEYTWDVSVRDKTDALEAFLLQLGGGAGNIPLYFHAVYHGTDGNDPRLSTAEYTRAAAIAKVHTTNIVLTQAVADEFKLRPNDNLQVGRYCLRIISVSESGRRLVIANMPVDAATGFSILIDTTKPSDTVRTSNYFMIGRNQSLDVGHGESRHVSGGEYPDAISFLEVP